MLDVICLGELLIDFVSPDVDASLAEAQTFIKAPGGAPANVAVDVQRLGARAGFIGAVGDDAFGHFLRDTVSATGVDVSGLRLTQDARTTLAFVATRADGRKDITFYRHPGADMLLRPEDVDEDALREARCFHYGSVSMSRSPVREATYHAARVAQEAGLLVSYDPNLRLPLWDDEGAAREAIWEGMRFATVAKLAEEEWEFITGTDSFEQGAAKILDQGPAVVIITRGEQGCWFTNGRDSGASPGYAVQVVDPLGAGDAFVAAVLVRLLECGGVDDLSGDELREIVSYANAVGAVTCLEVGVIPALPTRDQVTSFLATAER